jgi:hypothetical protein
MIDLEHNYAACDWKNCVKVVSVKGRTLREVYRELKQQGWRASANLGEYCICDYHNDPDVARSG